MCLKCHVCGIRGYHIRDILSTYMYLYEHVKIIQLLHLCDHIYVLLKWYKLTVIWKFNIDIIKYYCIIFNEYL